MAMDLVEAPSFPAQQVQKLRSELKHWEKAFAAANDGRKAGREDIKKEPLIAKKYKDYNKLRALSEKSLNEQASLSSLSRDNATPAKRRRLDDAPPHHPATIDPYDPPSQSTPRAQRRYVAPTPQKNGLVLGLFDLLSPPSARPSPSKGAAQPGMAETVPAQTPSKAPSKLDHALLKDFGTPIRRHLSTPQSSSKRNYLDAFFLTPSTRAQKTTTPVRSGSTAAVHDLDTTPAFLKRGARPVQLPPRLQRDNSNKANEALGVGADQGEGNANAGDELAEFSLSPVAVRMPRKPLGRSLSSLVQSLRKVEEDELDADLDVLREIEAEQEGGSGRTVHVADSQVSRSLPLSATGGREMPLGADGEFDVSDDEGDGAADGHLDVKGRPRKLWKKKGQKRTTRKANIRPSMAKWKAEAEWKWTGESDGEPAHEVAPNTQGAIRSANEGDSGDESQNNEAEDEGARRKKAVKPAKAKSTTKKPGKKINALAHTNFRALKIKNKNSRAKGAGRFGRRR